MPGSSPCDHPAGRVLRGCLAGLPMRVPVDAQTMSGTQITARVAAPTPIGVDIGATTSLTATFPAGNDTDRFALFAPGLPPRSVRDTPQNHECGTLPPGDQHHRVGGLGGSAGALSGIIVFAMPDDETDLHQKLEDLVPGSEVWEIAHRYRLHRYRHSDAEYQTVEVEIRHNRHRGWMIIARDPARSISAAGNPHPALNAAMATVPWQDLDSQTEAPQRSRDT